jgi:hypothetical protein
MDLTRTVKTWFNVTLAERSVGVMLRRLGFRRLSVRPGHPQQDPAAQDTQKNFADLVKAAIPEHAREQPIELWWRDEARVGQQGTLTRLWAERGSRHPRRGFSAANGPTYSALSVLVGILVRPWSCIMPTRKR